MIPPILGRRLRLQPPILDGEHVAEDPGLDHALAEEAAAVARARAQLLARRPHRLVLPLQLQLVRAPPLPLVQLPGAVDRPVSQVAGSREAEGAGRQRVPEEVADEGWSFGH